jgi:hypothetical protein
MVYGGERKPQKFAIAIEDFGGCGRDRLIAVDNTVEAPSQASCFRDKIIR